MQPTMQDSVHICKSFLNIAASVVFNRLQSSTLILLIIPQFLANSMRAIISINQELEKAENSPMSVKNRTE